MTFSNDGIPWINSYFSFHDRCDSHKVYVSTANGKLSKTPTETLGKNANGRMDNAVMINASAKGKYTWRVDCIEEGTGKTDRGDTWKFIVA